MFDTSHLLIAPILIPFFAGALMLLYDDRQRKAKFGIALVSMLLLLWVSVELLIRAKGDGPSGGTEIGFYLLGNWAMPFGIVLVLDRLAAMMVALTALLGIPALIYAGAGWHKQGQHFHSLFQFLIMGVNGAFLTGDLFNLFVFFEVLLAASYGLLLHGSGQFRVRAGLHYIAMNLAASLLFLIGVSLIYGVAGTLNMAHLAKLMPLLPESDRPLIHAGTAILAMAFLVKAGAWPLSFWLPTAYMAASAPVAAIFSIMTKVGVYSILRIWMLLYGPDSGVSAGFGGWILAGLGMATIVYGLMGVLASQGLGRMVGHLVLISSGTILAVTGFAVMGGSSAILSGALYYLVGSTLATGALFLLLEPMSREEGGIAAMLALTADAYGLEVGDEDDEPDYGLALPGTLMVLGLSFGLVMLAIAGLPPLSGFIGKLAMLSGVLRDTALPAWMGWTFLTLIIVAGFATTLGLVRVGIQTFWASGDVAPKVKALEIAPVVLLLALILATTVKAQDMIRYTDATARSLFDRSVYIDGVLSAPRVVPQAQGTAPAVASPAIEAQSDTAAELPVLDEAQSEGQP